MVSVETRDIIDSSPRSSLLKSLGAIVRVGNCRKMVYISDVDGLKVCHENSHLCYLSTRSHEQVIG